VKSETFFFFNRERIKSGARPRLETAVSYDLAHTIDHRNGWHESDAPDDELLNELRSIAARGLSEFVQFAFDGGPITPRKVAEAKRKLLAITLALHPEVVALNSVKAAKLVKATPRDLRKIQKEFFSRWGFRVVVKKRSRAG